MQQGGWTRSLSILSLSLGSTHTPHKGLKSKSESLGNICWHPSLTVFTVRTPSRVVEAQLLLEKGGKPAKSQLKGRKECRKNKAVACRIPSKPRWEHTAARGVSLHPSQNKDKLCRHLHLGRIFFYVCNVRTCRQFLVI